MEAYGNELLYAKEPNHRTARRPVNERSRKDGRSEVLTSFVVALEDAGQRLDEAAKAYKAAGALIAARNELMHFWPEWKDAKVDHAEIAEQLRGENVPPHPLFHPTTARFPEEYIGAGLAEWAYSTAKAFLEWAAKAVGDDDRKFE
jgi:hypothetical protein